MGKAGEAHKIKHLEVGQEERLIEEKQQKVVRGRVDRGGGGGREATQSAEDARQRQGNHWQTWRRGGGQETTA